MPDCFWMLAFTLNTKPTQHCHWDIFECFLEARHKSASTMASTSGLFAKKEVLQWCDYASNVSLCLKAFSTLTITSKFVEFNLSMVWLLQRKWTAWYI